MKRSWRGWGKESGEKGFTFMELMIVLAILSMLAALLTGPLLQGKRRGKLVKTEASMRNVGMPWCDRLANAYPNSGPGVPMPTDVPVSDFPVVLDAAQRLDLEALLGVSLPQYDAWNEEVEYRVDAYPASSYFMIRSRNGNRQWDDSPPYQWQTAFPETDEVTDLVWVNCDFVQFWSSL